jgi:peroxiredoxin
VASREPVSKIPLQELQYCYNVYFFEDSPLTVGVVHTNPTPDDYRHSRSEIKFWNRPGGEEIWSLASKEGEAIFSVKQTPDHRAIFVTTQSRDQASGRTLRVDLATHDVQVVLDEPNLRPDVPVFHPSGEWMILPVQEFNQAGLRDDVSPSELPQPRLQARDIASGALLEDLVAPQAFQNSVVFSRDGNTLASSGTGAVLLWDFRDPPGKTVPAIIGQPFEGAGTLASGKKLDWARYRGKVVLVTYWATWCQPCVAEIPELKKTYDALHKRGFEVLAVSLDDDRAVLDRFLGTQEVSWQVVCGAAGEALGRQHPLARKYGVDSIPKSFLIDRQGNIAAIDPHGAELVKLAENLLGTDGEKKAAQ